MVELRRRVGPRRRGPYVPAQVVLALVDERVPADRQYQGWEAAQVTPKLGKLIRSGEVDWLTIDQADRIIVRMLGDVGLWYAVPELAAVYCDVPPG